MRWVNVTFDRAKAGAWFIGAVGTLLILGGLTWFILERTRPPGVDVARAQLRAKTLAELRAENHAALTAYGWVDKTKGIVRLPIERAIALSLELGKDPAAARSNLLERLARATAKPPEPKNEYE